MPARSCAPTAGSSSKFGAVTLRLELDRHPEIWSSGDVDLKYLWDLFSTYVYLPRLRDVSVLTEAVREGASGFAWRDSFAYASGKAEDGRYLGLVMGARQFEPLVDGSGRIVKPEIAEAQPEIDLPAQEAGPGTRDRSPARDPSRRTHRRHQFGPSRPATSGPSPSMARAPARSSASSPPRSSPTWRPSMAPTSRSRSRSRRSARPASRPTSSASSTRTRPS